MDGPNLISRTVVSLNSWTPDDTGKIHLYRKLRSRRSACCRHPTPAGDERMLWWSTQVTICEECLDQARVGDLVVREKFWTNTQKTKHNSLFIWPTVTVCRSCHGGLDYEFRGKFVACRDTAHDILMLMAGFRLAERWDNPPPELPCDCERS